MERKLFLFLLSCFESPPFCNIGRLQLVVDELSDASPSHIYIRTDGFLLITTFFQVEA